MSNVRHSDDPHIPDDVILLPADRYEAMVDGIVKKCERWLTGEMPATKLVVMFNSLSRWRYFPSELNNKPDDYNWDQVPQEIWDRVEAADAKDPAGLERVVRAAIESMNAEASPDTVLTRGYWFGKCSLDCGYRPE